MRRKFLIYSILSLLVTSSCHMYQDEIDYYRQISQSINENLSSAQSSIQTYYVMLELLRDNDFVTEVTPIQEDSKTVGYCLLFSKGEKLILYFGKDGQKGDPGKDGEDGADGRTPVVELVQHSDGKCYWSVNGNWLIDEYGKKIPSGGNNGITPIVRLDGKIWMVSYDNGQTWSPLGSSVLVSVSIFKYVEVTEGGIVMVYLQDGEVITIPTYKSMKLTLENASVFESDQKQNLKYQIEGVADQNADVELSYTISKGWKVRIIRESNLSGTLEVTPAQDYQPNADLIFFASSNGQTISTHQSLKMKEPLPEEFVNLSKKGTANCYIVNQRGKYCYYCKVRGGSTYDVGNVASAEVLWETFGTDKKPQVGDVVSNVFYSNGFIFFTSGYDGNAVIAAKDESGEILWSWHIWVCNGFDPEATAQVYNNNAGTMMDRNLGALSATPGDTKAFGLHYEWGRKDPFPGPVDSEGSGYIATTNSYWSRVVQQTSGVDYSISHPTIYITSGATDGDWLKKSDTSLWGSNKTVYDPCPYGWRVPDGGSSGVWAKASGITTYERPSVSCSKAFPGVNFGISCKCKMGENQTIWYPISGTKDCTSGVIYKVSTFGGYWACTSYSYHADSMYFDLDRSKTSASVCILGITCKAYSHPVRCQAVK